MDQVNAARRLSDISFEKQGCHISIVGPSMGGPANGVETLTLKSVAPLGDSQMAVEMIEKSAVDTLITKAVDAATATLKAELEAIKIEKAASVEATRKAKLVEILGDVEGAATLTVLKSLDDAAFEVVLKSMKVAKDAESKSAMFTQKGVDGKGDITRITADAGESGTMKFLKAANAAKAK